MPEEPFRYLPSDAVVRLSDPMVSSAVPAIRSAVSKARMIISSSILLKAIALFAHNKHGN